MSCSANALNPLLDGKMSDTFQA